VLDCNEGHSSFFDFEELINLFPIGFCIVDGKDILNDRGINWPPRNLVKDFFITASPNVFDGEILGLGNAPFQGFFFYGIW
jgi:hypothetical protein